MAEGCVELPDELLVGQLGEAEKAPPTIGANSCLHLRPGMKRLEQLKIEMQVLGDMVGTDGPQQMALCDAQLVEVVFHDPAKHKDGQMAHKRTGSMLGKNHTGSPHIETYGQWTRLPVKQAYQSHKNHTTKHTGDPQIERFG
ncbi:unnamed protein product [Linum trigynum]|uniref:Uncharacterized protein n=1 Tax=Linum trigynum TaxID=586398 RepID=A0AAV2CFU4_9ROSI